MDWYAKNNPKSSSEHPNQPMSITIQIRTKTPKFILGMLTKGAPGLLKLLMFSLSLSRCPRPWLSFLLRIWHGCKYGYSQSMSKQCNQTSKNDICKHSQTRSVFLTLGLRIQFAKTQTIKKPLLHHLHWTDVARFCPAPMVSRFVRVFRAARTSVQRSETNPILS